MFGRKKKTAFCHVQFIQYSDIYMIWVKSAEKSGKQLDIKVQLKRNPQEPIINRW